MKILLDESLPRKLKDDFSTEHEVYTVRDMGWLGKKNGELLRIMSKNKFDIFITVDRNLPYQQNTEKVMVPIFILCAVNNQRKTLGKLIPKIFEKIEEEEIQKFNEIF